MAATTITAAYPTSTTLVSPFSATFFCAGNDETSAGTLNRAGVLAGCVAGPLKALLASTPDWTVFNLGGAQCGQVHVRNVNVGGPTPVSVASLVNIVWVANGLKAAVATGDFPIEVRLTHTLRT